MIELSDLQIKSLVIKLIEGDLDRAMAGNLKSQMVMIQNLQDYVKRNPPTLADSYYSILREDIKDKEPASLSHHTFVVLTDLLELTDREKKAVVRKYIPMVVKAAGTMGHPLGIEIAHAREAEKIYYFLLSKRRK